MANFLTENIEVYHYKLGEGKYEQGSHRLGKKYLRQTNKQKNIKRKEQKT